MKRFLNIFLVCALLFGCITILVNCGDGKDKTVETDSMTVTDSEGTQDDTDKETDKESESETDSGSDSGSESESESELDNITTGSDKGGWDEYIPF